MTDPQWTAEFAVNDNVTGARREVRVDSPELQGAVFGAIRGMGAIFGAELGVAVEKFEQAFGALNLPERKDEDDASPA